MDASPSYLRPAAVLAGSLGVVSVCDDDGEIVVRNLLPTEIPSEVRFVFVWAMSHQLIGTSMAKVTANSAQQTQ